MTDDLAARRFALPCAECGKTSLKSFLQLEMEDRLPCDSCGVSIKVTDHYSRADLERVLEGLGRKGFILRERNEGR